MTLCGKDVQLTPVILCRAQCSNWNAWGEMADYQEGRKWTRTKAEINQIHRSNSSMSNIKGNSITLSEGSCATTVLRRFLCHSATAGTINKRLGGSGKSGESTYNFLLGWSGASCPGVYNTKSETGLVLAWVLPVKYSWGESVALRRNIPGLWSLVPSLLHIG